MSDTADLTLLSGTVQETARELRLLRLQVESVSARMATLDQRLGTVDQRLTNLEQGTDRLTSEVSRGFGQLQQQLTRAEKRFDALDAGLAALRDQASDDSAKLAEILRILQR